MKKAERIDVRYDMREHREIRRGWRQRFTKDGVLVEDNPEMMLMHINDNRDWFVDTVRSSSYSDIEVNFESNNIR